MSKFFSLETEPYFSTYYSVIPSPVKYDEVLSSTEKLLYGELCCIFVIDERVEISNTYLAARLNITTRQVQRALKHLEERNHIRIYNENNIRKIVPKSY